MTNHYSYQLEPYHGRNSRYTCPGCKKSNQFVRYVHTITNQPLGQHVGRCNRENKCGYHYTPRQFINDKRIIPIPTPIRNKTTAPTNHLPSYIPLSIFKASLKNYTQNHFTNYLCGRLGAETTQRLIAQFYIGTANHWPGSTVFWQIDNQGRICTGKIMLYDPKKGTCTKEPFDHITCGPPGSTPEALLFSPKPFRCPTSSSKLNKAK